MTKLQRKYEKGDAGVVILVVLVVALLGVLGWMFWQNMDKKNDTNTQQTQQQNNNTTQKEATLAIKDWGVEMPVGDALKTVSITATPNEDWVTYEVLVSESVLFDDESKTDTQALGMIERFKASDTGNGVYGDGSTFAELAKQPKNEGKMVQVGDYVYVYISRQNGAYEGKTGAEKAADKKLETLSTVDFPAAFKQLRVQE